MLPSISVATWNALAHSYHVETDASFELRKHQIREVLTRCPVDILCLQEVDCWEEFWAPTLLDLGYEAEFFQRPQRRDGLVIAVQHAGLSLLRKEKVFFDDLADKYDDLQFKRQNIGLLCEFRSVALDRTVVVANTHLYWNPQKPEVKMGQLQMLRESLLAFAGGDVTAQPIILAGDFNASPDGALVGHLTRGLDMTPSVQYFGPDTTFLCDASLLKICKWLRLLGVNAKMEAEESHLARTKKPKKKAPNGEILKQGPDVLDYSLLFDTARTERRVLLTSSKNVRERAACPPSHLVNTGNFEAALVTIVSKYGLDIREDKFLTVCGKCGGKIAGLADVRNEVQREAAEIGKEVGSKRDADLEDTEGAAVCHYYQLNACREGDSCKYLHIEGGEGLTGAASPPTPLASSEKGKIGSDLTYIPPDKPIFACTECHQIYWWNDRSDSSPARAMRVAMKLLDMVKNNSSDMLARGAANMPTSVYATGLDEGSGDVEREKHIGELTCLFQTRDQALLDEKDPGAISESPSKKSEAMEGTAPYVSSFAQANSGQHVLTNWNKEFTATLDYVFVPRDGPLCSIEAEVIPRLLPSGEDVDTAGADVDADGVSPWVITARSQPTTDWPSDHFLVKSELRLGR